MHDHSPLATFLFTDIEGSTRLWEESPERMRAALAAHDELARATVEGHGGRVVKMTGDGLHAAFDDPLDAVGASVALQQGMARIESAHGVALRVRCGLHAGASERRDNDFYGSVVNRAARITAAAHGGQMLLSAAVAELLRGRLPGEVELVDLGSVRLRDLAQPERIFQLAHPRLRREFPALRALEEVPNNLPPPLSSFVGRERELAHIRRLLRETRLLTLTGMGGLGKSRLSLEAAAAALEDFPDGVWLVELAPVHDARRLDAAVAATLHVKEEAARAVAETLERHVRDRRLLLVLDNCEHLLQACAELARRLLLAGRGVRILASSREALHVAGETTFPVLPLGLPSLLATGEPVALMNYESVRLFVERARAAQPGFELDERSAAPVTAIVHRLDGIPLALELAAARVRSLTVEQIAARLTDRFRLLSRGDPTALPRQQTLRALIDWSHDLLDAAERSAFHQLAVFAGGWSLEAAEAVVLLPAEEASALDVLGQLVEKSLVVADPETGRYRLLETVRQYAQDKLQASGELAAVCDRHLAFYVALAEEAKGHLAGSEQAGWMQRLDRERENLVAAHEWTAHARDGARLDLVLVNAVKRYWMNSGSLEVGTRLTLEALEREGARARDALRLRALFDAGQLTFLMGRYAEARALLEESLAIARELDDERKVAVVLTPLAATAAAQSDLQVARRCLDEGLAIAERLGDGREIAAACAALGQVRRMEGNWDEAERLFERTIALARAADDAEAVAIALLNLAMVAIGRGERAKAGRWLSEAAAIVMEIRSQRAGQSALEVCAALATLAGDWERAARLFGAAETHAGDIGLRRDATDEAFLAPRVQAAREALGPERFGALESAGRALAYDDAIDEARAWLATCR